ncbi:MAG: hypothetical protein F4220_10945 [Gammaproteobacteria bacterium]|nr:hypothetical protein [Gammaproteobacteria bacterium]
MRGLTWPERALAATAAAALALSAFVAWSWAGRPEPTFEPQAEGERVPATVGALRSAEPPDEALRSWFGVSEPLTLVPESLPETDLDLMLEGVFVDADPSRSSALIAADGVVERYFPGDEVASARLIQVHGNLVVIRRGGESEALRFLRLNRLTEKGSDSVDSQPRRQ